MLTRSPSSPASLSQRTVAQRRLRRTSTNRLLCSTNGCATFLQMDGDRHLAVCPICGYARRATDQAGATTRH